MMRGGGRMITAVGPVHLPPVDTIADRVTALAEAGGRHTILGNIPSPQSSRWQYRPRQFLSGIDEYRPCTKKDVPRLLMQLARSNSREAPLRIGVAGDYLFLDISHGLGDGRLALQLMGALAADGSEATVPDWARRRDARVPIVRALAGQYSFAPQRLVQLVRTRTGVGEGGPSDAAPVPWTRSPGVVVASSVPGMVDRLREWRDRMMPGASVSALLFAAISESLRRRALAIDHHVGVIFDCRRYLPNGVAVNGNFVAGVGLDLADPGDARELSAAIRQATHLGRPLASLALSAAKFNRDFRMGNAYPVAKSVAAEPRAKLVFSDMGEATPLAGLRWTDVPGRRFCNAISEPAAPDEVVFTFVHRGAELDVTASSHDNVFDSALVDAALMDALRDPVSLLSLRNP